MDDIETVRNICVTNKEINVRDVIDYVIKQKGQNEAFYVCDLTDIARKYHTWTTLMPRIKPFYAVKCNHTSLVLRTLAALGTDFDCSSKPEISKVLNAGVAPDRIIYAHTAKIPNHIDFAVAQKVYLATFDCESELVKCSELYPGVKLLIRIKVDSSKASFDLGLKYGCDPFKEAPELLRRARDLNVSIVGVAFHVGSQSHYPLAFRTAIEAAKSVFTCATSLGFDFSLLDIGGGFPGAKNPRLFSEFAEVVNSALDDFFPDPNVTIIAEPGTYFVKSAFTLICNVISTKMVRYDKAGKEMSEPKRVYLIDDGVYGSMFAAYFKQVEEPTPLYDTGDGKLYRSTIFGPTSDIVDTVFEEVLLPELKNGDWLVFENMGDYSLCMSSEFNGFFPPKVFTVADPDMWSMVKVEFSDSVNLGKNKSKPMDLVCF